MSKNKILFKVGIFIATVSLVGCGKNKSNSNMMTQSDSTLNAKWNNFADVVGVAHIEDTPPFSDKPALTAVLSTPPANFQPASDGSNVDNYTTVKNAVSNFVSNEAPHMQASKIVSIVPFDKNILGADSVDNGANFISIPYLERNAANANAQVDLSQNKTNSGIDENGKFYIYQTVNGKVVPNKVTDAHGSVYLVTYQLGGDSTQNYLALVTIPDGVTSANPVPLMLFAHGGDAGLVFSEMATLLQGNLGKFIIAAPVYPGEPICAVAFSEGNEQNNYARNCLDHNGNSTTPVVAAIGNKSPMKNDVDSLLGLQNGIWQLTLNNYKSDFYSGINYFIDSKTSPSSPTSIIPFYGSAATGIQTIGVADSRGGGTLMAAIGRHGILLSLNKIDHYIFSGAAFFYSPSSFLVGQFRILTQYMMNGVVPNNFNGLPMVPEMTHYFDTYRNAPMGSDAENNELQNLVGFMGASDMTYLAPYINADMQNWNEKNAGYTPAPGSIIFLHGTQDALVPFTESLIAKTAMDQVFDNIYEAGENDSLFLASAVALGSQMYSFEPDAAYYNLNCTDKMDPTALNTTSHKCFGGGYNSTTSISTDHGLDSSFLTSHLINPGMQTMNLNSKALDQEFLYGADAAVYNYNVGSFAEQFAFFNSAHAANYPKRGTPYALVLKKDQCNLTSTTKNGFCYLYSDINQKNTSNLPLYNRTMLQDETQGNSSMYTGVWDDGAQSSALTPSDILNEWVSVNVLGDRGVLKSFF